MNKNILMIGASSGVGKNVLKNLLLDKNCKIYATQYKSKIINSNKNLKTFSLNLSNLKSIKNFIYNLKNIKFDTVLLVAAVTTNTKNTKNSKFGNLDKSYFNKFMSINCFGNIKVFESLVKMKKLKKNAKIIFFSSLAGSIEMRGKMKHNKKFGNLFYRISKAALNCAIKNLSYDFKERFTIVALHPGYTSLGSGKNDAVLDKFYVIKTILKTINFLKKRDNGKFINFDGSSIKW